MSTNKRIAKNTMILNAGHVVAKVINFVLILVITRMLTPDGFGVFSFAQAFVMMFMVLNNLGLNTLLVRDIAQNRSKAAEITHTALSVVLVLSLLVPFLVNGLAWLLGWSVDTRLLIFWFSIYLFFDGWSRSLIAIIRAFEKMSYEAVIYIFERFGLLLVTVTLWYLQGSLVQLVAAYAGVMSVKAVVTLLVVHHRFVPLRWQWHKAQALAMLRAAYPFCLVSVFGEISMRIDTLMLEHFHATDTVGIYNVARRLLESLSFIPENIVFALFPAMSLLYVQSSEGFRNTFGQALRYMLIIALPVAIGLNLFSETIVGLLFEPEYLRAAVALQWLAAVLGLLFVKHLFATTLNAIGKQHLFLVISGFTMVANIAMNWWLIPQWEIVGAAFATVVSESLSVVWMVWVLRKDVSLRIADRFYLRLAAVTLIWSVSVWWYRDSYWLLAGVLAALEFGMLLWLFRLLPANLIGEFFGRGKC